jgi:hypothetical protein
VSFAAAHGAFIEGHNVVFGRGEGGLAVRIDGRERGSILRSELREALEAYEEHGGDATELVRALDVEGMFSPLGERLLVELVRRAIAYIAVPFDTEHSH